MKKRSPDAVSSAMKDHTIRRMYTKRASGDINIYAMKDNNTTQELSKKEKARLAEKRCYEANKEKRLETARKYYLKNKERLRKLSDSHYQKNKKKRLAKGRKHYYENRKRILEVDKKYREKNKQKINDYLKVYREANGEKIREAAKASYQKHRERRLKESQIYGQRPDIKQKHNARIKQRRLTDPNFKLCRVLRNQLYQHLKINKTKKSKSALQLVGCSISELKEYIERQWLPGMTWESYTVKGWHVDHIRPVNTFDLTDIEQQKKCFHYTNLRPLWATDNLSRPHDGSDIITTPTQTQ